MYKVYEIFRECFALSFHKSNELFLAFFNNEKRWYPALSKAFNYTRHHTVLKSRIIIISYSLSLSLSLVITSASERCCCFFFLMIHRQASIKESIVLERKRDDTSRSPEALSACTTETKRSPVIQQVRVLLILIIFASYINFMNIRNYRVWISSLLLVQCSARQICNEEKLLL